MAISLRGNNGLLSRLNDLIKLQRLKHALANGEVLRALVYTQMDFHSAGRQDAANIDMSKWNKVNGRVFGINRSMIPSPSWTVLKILHSKGFDAYLVGGCVRDLILNRAPKDFDVITTAGLKQIRKQFHHARIIGHRFPICMVNIKGSVIEVSSFETIAKHVKEKEIVTFSQVPKECDKKDLIRWRNSMLRDFTINSLFFDPFLNIIYDYAEGIADLRSLKLRTLIPASLSFKEDCARILRGLRIAARLGLSLSKDTETAMRKLFTSITSLGKSRIMMELNYMLSYGAAEPSICLLQRFNLLKILLPFHAAYLELNIKKSPLNSMMLMKLFFNLDKLVSCDRPSDCNIWVGLLAFHMALVNHPQDPLIVLAFAATLYHGEWNKGVNFARKNSQAQINFVPEITRLAQFKSDEELARGVTHFASLVQGSIAAFTATDSLMEVMSTFPDFPCSGLVFVPKKTAKDVAGIFEVLVNDIEAYKVRRENFEIDYQLLGKGILSESRYVLGKVIWETLNSAIVLGGRDVLDEKRNLCVDTMEEHYNSALVNDQLVVKKDRKARKKPCSSEVMLGANKKYKSVQKEESLYDKMVESRKSIIMAEKHQSAVETYQLPPVESMLETNKCHLSKVRETENKQEDLETLRNQDKEKVQPQEARDEVTKKLLQTVKANARKRDEVIEQTGEPEKRVFSSLSQGHKEKTKKEKVQPQEARDEVTKKLLQTVKAKEKTKKEKVQPQEARDEVTKKLLQTVKAKEKTKKEKVQPQEARDEVTKRLLQIVKANARKRDDVIEQAGESEKRVFSSLSQGHKEKTKKEHRNVTGNEQCVRPLSSLFK